MRYRRFFFLITLIVCFTWPLPVIGGDTGRGTQNRPVSPPSPAPPPGEPGRQINAPVLKMVAPGIFEMGGVKILKQEDKVEFPAKVNMDKGLLEYLIVGDVGKVHESLLRTEVEPYSLQIALLMIGLEGSTNPLAQQGDTRKPEGDPVSIWIKLKKGDQILKARIEEWVFNKKNRGIMKPVNWIFTGSVIWNGVFMAQAEKSIVAVFHDPVAMIDNPLPEGSSDEVWFVNEGRVPPVGTAVTVIIRKETKTTD